MVVCVASSGVGTYSPCAAFVVSTRKPLGDSAPPPGASTAEKDTAADGGIGPLFYFYKNPEEIIQRLPLLLRQAGQLDGIVILQPREIVQRGM